MSNELDAIFGRKPEAEPAAPKREILEVYVTTNLKDTFKAVTIPADQAMTALPLILAQLSVMIAHYATNGE